MESENNTGVVLLCVNNFLIVSVAKECKCYAVSTERGLDNIRNIFFISFRI